VAASGAQTAHGPSGWVLRLTLESVAPAPPPVTAADGRHEVAVFDISRLVWPAAHAFRPRTPAMAPHYDSPDGDPWNTEDKFILFPGREPRDMEELRERIDRIVGEGDGSLWQHPQGNWLFACGSPGALAVVRQELEATESPEPDLVLTLQAALPGDDGRPRAEASLRLPLRPQDAALAWCGAEGLSTIGWDVDVAEGSAIPDPVVLGFFDGLAVRAGGRARGGARVELVLHRAIGWERVPLNASGIEAFERPVWTVLSIERDLATGASVRLEGVADPFSPLASLAIDVELSAR
jgi:hypothetical protein